MNLPVLVTPPEGGEPVISVDGAWGAPGLNLSHWPGNTTPEPLRHRLSTGSALAFARLSDAEKENFAPGAVAIVNNHYDTDGALSLFAVRHPELALPRADAMLAAAAAGDFFELPNEDAFVVDQIVSGLVDPERSPLASELQGLDDDGRYALATAHLLERFPAILDGDVDPYRALFEEALERVRRDIAAVNSSARDDERELELTIWRSLMPWPETGPGRHALFGTSERDRAFVVAPFARGAGVATGFGYRLILSTRSWFDLPTNADLRTAGRPDLEALAAKLNEDEGTVPDGEFAWRAQNAIGASPELWFGRDGQPLFAEHSNVLAPSSLEPEHVAEAVRSSLAAAMPA